MKKVAIVCPGGLPVPNVRGGAVETGIQQIVDVNEMEKRCDLTIYTPFDKDALEKSKEYKNTNFAFISKPYIAPFLILLTKCINKVARALNNKAPQLPVYFWYLKKVCVDIEKKSFDSVLVKNMPIYIEPLKPYVTGKLYLQIHNDMLNEKTYHARKILGLCDAIITNSEYIRQCVLRVDDSAFDKILINRNCTELERFDRNTLEISRIQEWKEKSQISPTDVVIIYSGRLNIEKGVMELIDAANMLPVESNFKLLLVGSKWYGKTTNDQFTKKLKSGIERLDAKVKLLGFVSYQEMPYVYAMADICVVPSQWEEPAGRVVLEAEVSGAALIISDAGGMKEYTLPDASITVPRGVHSVEDLAQALKELITDGQKRKNLAEKGHKFASSFTPERCFNEIMDALLK